MTDSTLSPTNTPIYLALDPGDTTGWATFAGDGSILGMGQIAEKEYNRWLSTMLNKGVETVICEDYRNHGWMNQPKWQRNKTSKKIGGLEAIAELLGIEVILQPNTVKSVGYMWGGLQKASNHAISHQFDALAHGIHYMISNKIVPMGYYLKARGTT